MVLLSRADRGSVGPSPEQQGQGRPADGLARWALRHHRQQILKRGGNEWITGGPPRSSNLFWVSRARRSHSLSAPLPRPGCPTSIPRDPPAALTGKGPPKDRSSVPRRETTTTVPLA